MCQPQTLQDPPAKMAKPEDTEDVRELQPENYIPRTQGSQGNTTRSCQVILTVEAAVRGIRSWLGKLETPDRCVELFWSSTCDK